MTTTLAALFAPYRNQTRTCRSRYTGVCRVPVAQASHDSGHGCRHHGTAGKPAPRGYRGVAVTASAA